MKKERKRERGRNRFRWKNEQCNFDVKTARDTNCGVVSKWRISQHTFPDHTQY